MSEVSIITNDEIMEMTQLVFDRYYTELKRQLRRGEIPAEYAEQYCTEILAKVYQALQTQGVAATSYEMDACAIPIINEEIRKILVPLHLNGYRNLRENPVTEAQPHQQEAVPEPAQQEAEDDFSALQEVDVTEIKNDELVQVVSNGTVQVCKENTESDLNPELRMEIRRILQQEFQLEPTQVKPIVVVVNVAAPQPTVQAVTETEADEKQESSIEETEEFELTGEELAAILEREEVREEFAMAGSETAATVNTAEAPETETPEREAAQAEVPEEQAETHEEELPELVFDFEKLTQDEEVKTKKKNRHLWLWFPIVLLLIILIWLTAGMLMNYDIIPELNLGYEWFNETLFELF